MQSGCRTLLTKIRFTPLSVTFAELFLHLSEEDDRVGERCVYKVTVADRPGNRGGTEVDLTAPVMLCDEFNVKYVTFFSSNDESVTATPTFNHHPNAFQVLMHASRDISHLPSTIEASEHRQMIATECLHNGVIKYMKSTGAAFTRGAVNTFGIKVVKTLRDALRYIDSAYQQFEERSIHLPNSFKEFQGYNNFKKNRKTKPRMNADELTHHTEALAGLLMFPSLSASNCKTLMTDIAELCECLRAYATYLKKHNEKQQEVHASSQPLRDPAVYSVAMVIVASELSPPHAELQSPLDAVSHYDPVCVNDFSPVDRFLRRAYISQLFLSVSVYMYRMAYGSAVSTLTFIWKIDQSLPDHEKRNAHALVEVTETLPK